MLSNAYYYMHGTFLLECLRVYLTGKSREFVFILSTTMADPWAQSFVRRLNQIMSTCAHTHGILHRMRPSVTHTPLHLFSRCYPEVLVFLRLYVVLVRGQTMLVFGLRRIITSA